MNMVTPYPYQPTRNKFLSILNKVFSQWQHKLRVILAGLILAQFVIWFDSYWFSATTWLVSTTLVITCLIEMFPRIHWTIRRSAELLLIIIIHMDALNVSWTSKNSGWLEGRFAWLGDTISSVGQYWHDITPYIWFSLVAWGIYLALTVWLTERSRIMVIVVVSVLIFAVVDSYSMHIFWEQVACIIFSGLALIVIEHFEHFRRKHPVSWSYFSDYPFVIATPIILIIGVIMLVGSLAPNARPILTDPYTAYKHMKGEKVITPGKDFGTSSNISLLNTTSGYGRDDSAIGGGFDFDFSEVLRVETEQRSYLRGETKSLYTGKGWELSERDIAATSVNAAYTAELQPFEWGAEPSYRSVEVEQIIRLTNDKSYPVLFGAYMIKSIENVQNSQGPGVEGLPSDAYWSSAQAELRWDSDVDYPLMYTLQSELPIIDEVALREGPALRTDYESEEWAPYLQLPETLPNRVRELTQDITRNALTPYDKVKQIEAYLQTNYQYANRPDLSLGKSNDFVDRFLFEIQTGYCDYFSTSMAVMVRTLGLPTRWVKGYTGGSLEVDEFLGAGVPEQIANLVGEQMYIVRNSDSHSWVEVYFDGWGWLPFEATSGFVLPTVTEAEEVLASDLNPLTNELVNAEDGAKNGVWTTPWKIILMAVSFIFVASMVWLGIRFSWWRRIAFILFRRQSNTLNMNQLALQELNGIFRMFKRKGYIRYIHETLRESFARWIGHNQWLKKDLDQLLVIMEKARYSPFTVTQDDLLLIGRMKRKLKEEL